MSKLEETLNKLGYKLYRIEYVQSYNVHKTYKKDFEHCYIAVNISKGGASFDIRIVLRGKGFSTEQELTDLKQALKQLQKDWKIIKNYDKDDE